MELFKSEVLRKEYEEFSNKLLPAVLECGFCNKMFCKYHKKFEMQCSQCRAEMCKNCRRFNLSKDILLSKASPETIDCLYNFISDFLNLSDESLKTYFPEIKVEKIKTVNFVKRVKKEKNRSQVVNQVLPSDLTKGHFQYGRWKRRFY